MFVLHSVKEFDSVARVCYIAQAYVVTVVYDHRPCFGTALQNLNSPQYTEVLHFEHKIRLFFSSLFLFDGVIYVFM